MGVVANFIGLAGDALVTAMTPRGRAEQEVVSRSAQVRGMARDPEAQRAGNRVMHARRS